MTSLIHDIGNPPFGHFAEVALNSWMKNKGTKIFDNVVQVDELDEKTKN